MRSALRQRLEAEKLTTSSSFFEPGSYNVEATVGENLLFGTVTDGNRWEKALEDHPFFKTVLKRAACTNLLRDGAGNRRERRGNCSATCRRTTRSSSSSPS